LQFPKTYLIFANVIQHPKITSGVAAIGETWQTLSGDEWEYLIKSRSGNRFAKATVNDVKGLILLPDNWDADESNASDFIFDVSDYYCMGSNAHYLGLSVRLVRSL